jgi:hypothetical protein
MKTTVKSATKNQRIVNTKQTSKANVNKKRVIVYIPIFKSDEASVIKIKQEGSFIESPILQLEETIVIKQEDCFDQKLSSLQTISTEQGNQRQTIG